MALQYNLTILKINTNSAYLDNKGLMLTVIIYSKIAIFYVEISRVSLNETSLVGKILYEYCSGGGQSGNVR